MQLVHRHPVIADTIDTAIAVSSPAVWLQGAIATPTSSPSILSPCDDGSHHPEDEGREACRLDGRFNPEGVEQSGEELHPLHLEIEDGLF